MRTRWAVALLALVLALAACGGGDSDDSDDDVEAGATTTEGDGGGETTEAPPETSATTEESSSGGGLVSSAWCDLADDTQAQFDLAAENPFELFTPEGMATLSDLLDDAVQAAPPEIRDDVAVTRESFGELRGILESYDFDLFQIPPDELDAAFDQAELDRAANAIETYNQEVCGITPADGITEVTEAPESDDGGSTSDAPVDLFVDSLTQSLGVTEEQARCLADELDIGSILQDGGDPSAVIAEGIFDVLDACDISPADLVGG